MPLTRGLTKIAVTSVFRASHDSQVIKTLFSGLHCHILFLVYDVDEKTRHVIHFRFDRITSNRRCRGVTAAKHGPITSASSIKTRNGAWFEERAVTSGRVLTTKFQFCGPLAINAMETLGCGTNSICCTGVRRAVGAHDGVTAPPRLVSSAPRYVEGSR